MQFAGHSWSAAFSRTIKSLEVILENIILRVSRIRTVFLSQKATTAYFSKTIASQNRLKMFHVAYIVVSYTLLYTVFLWIYRFGWIYI